MDSIKFDNVCRICLENNAEFNWNDEILEFPGVSYKNCYYKYTAMVEIDADFYPTKLCGRCAGEVKNAHILFEKALESFIILTNTVKAKERGVPSGKGSQKNRFQNGALERNCFQKSKNTQLCIDNFNIKKLLPSVINLKKSNNNRKPFTTALELNLQLEICSSKLSKSTADKNAIETFKPLKKERCKDLGKTRNLMDATMVQRTRFSDNISLSKNSSLPDNAEQQHLPLTVQETQLQQLSSFSIISADSTKTQQWSLTIERTQFTDHSSLPKISPDNTEHQQLPLSKSFNKDEQTFKLLNYPMSKTKFDESGTNSSDLNETETSLPIDVSEEEEILNKQSDYSILEQDLSEEHVSNPEEFLETNYPISKESEKSSVGDDTTNENKIDTLTPSDISLLQKIYGENCTAPPAKKKKSIVREKICQYCSLKVMGTARLLMHEATHIEHRERNVICSECGIKLYNKLALSEHMKTHIKNREKRHKCEFCEKAFFHKGALNIHRRVHLGLMVKCQMCPKEFYRKIDLERHLPSHSVSLPQNSGSKMIKYTVQCQYCDKRIKTDHWKTHKLMHLKIPQMQCKICNRDFYSRNACTRHLRKVHRMPKSEYNTNIHLCDDNMPRMTRLMLEQQETLLPATE